LSPGEVRIWLLGIVVLAVILVFIFLPGKKSPVYHRNPQPEATLTQPKQGALCPTPNQHRAAADDHTYVCTKFSDGKYRWAKKD